MRSHRFARVAAILLTSLAAASLALAQDWRGNGRIQGTVTDEASGEPLAGVTIKADCPERGGGTTITSDKNGRWVLPGVVACTWNLDFAAEGYETLKIGVRLPGESVRIAPVKVTLKKAGPPPELKEAAEEAEAAYKAGNYEEARKEYEKVLAMRPDLATTVEQQIGFSYIQEKQYAKALEYLDKVLAADPSNTQIRAIAAQAALEGGMMDRARELLAGLDESKITNPDVFFNMGVNFLNAGQTDLAIEYFGKAIKVDPSYADAYYRRALGYLGQGKSAEAKSDFEKVVELQPDSEMGKMSKKALEQIK
jgi:tetratricopeptide (TPR) repeat protein